MNPSKKEKILLVLMPFWTPLVPPLGISCLKSHLQKHNYEVVTVDANTEEAFKEIYQHYFDTLKEIVPEQKRGNFNNIGNDVLRNHLMAHIRMENQQLYNKLARELVFQTFFVSPDDSQISKLSDILDQYCHRLEDYILALLKKVQPGILGLSVFSGNLPTSLLAFKLTKTYFPEIKTVMGGGVFADQLNPDSPNFDTFLESEENIIDAILIGEGEQLFLQYLEGNLEKKRKYYTIQDVKCHTFQLEHADVPDFSEFQLINYPYISIYTSRSCPFQCSFCSETVQWGKYRKKSASAIMEELVSLRQQYGRQLFLMGDSLLNPVVTELSEQLIHAGHSIYWDGYLRADPPVCIKENSMLWRRGGFYRARLGVESGSDRVLGLMGKKLTQSQIHDAVVSLALAGIKTTTYWVIGHPGESEEDFVQTLNLIRLLKDHIYEAECNPFNFFPTGQVNSPQWQVDQEINLLYPEEMSKMLLTKTWILNGEPGREETYNRINRFTKHCRELGIPNPYTMSQIHEADQRWQNLHPNAVPPLIEFDISQNEIRNIEENKYARELVNLEQKEEDAGDFLF